jgi:hypothetical protein
LGLVEKGRSRPVAQNENECQFVTAGVESCVDQHVSSRRRATNAPAGERLMPIRRTTSVGAPPRTASLMGRARRRAGIPSASQHGGAPGLVVFEPLTTEVRGQPCTGESRKALPTTREHPAGHPASKYSSCRVPRARRRQVALGGPATSPPYGDGTTNVAVPNLSGATPDGLSSRTTEEPCRARSRRGPCHLTPAGSGSFPMPFTKIDDGGVRWRGCKLISGDGQGRLGNQAQFLLRTR